MSLAERFAEPPEARLQCKVRDILDGLTESERKVLTGVLDSPRPSEGGVWSDSKIVEALRAEGWTVGPSVIERHRKHTCRCPVKS